MTLSAADRPFGEVATDLGYSTGVSVVVPKGEYAPVTVDWLDADGEAAFRTLADQAGLQARLRDGVVTFSSTGKMADVFSVAQVGAADSTEMVDLLKSVLGAEGDVKPVGDRLVVFGSTAAVGRARELIEATTYGPDGWLLQVALVDVSSSLVRDLGIGLGLAGGARASIGVAIGEIGGHVTAAGLGATAAVEAIGRATESGTEAQIVTMGSLFLLEGEDAELQRGDVVPVPKKTVSAEGVVTTTGYERIKTGFNLTARGKRVGDRLLLTLTPNVSGVAGFVEEAPIVRERSVTGTAVVSSGDWLILAGLEELESSTTVTGMPGLPASRFFNREESRTRSSTTLVLVKAIRVQAAIGGG